MLDLDKYINDGIRVKLFEKEFTLKQATAKQAKELSKLEMKLYSLANNKEVNEETKEQEAYDIRAELTLKILNNNAEGIVFTKADIEKIPLKLQIAINNKVAGFIYDLENDPN